MIGTAIAVLVVMGLGALTLAVLHAAGKASRNEEREELIRRCGGRANTYTPPPAATWTPERIVQGGGMERAR